MQYASVNSFIRGLFKQDEIDNKIQDQFLTTLLNVDLLSTGKMVRRRGYAYWIDLLNSQSDDSSINLPVISTDDVQTGVGFQNKIQSLFNYADVAGKEYLFATSNGKVYFETLEQSVKQWSCLNPTGNIDLVDKENHIDIVSYLDKVFFNDYKNNVYMYNSQTYSNGGWYSSSNTYVYFAGYKIYIRSYIDFSADSTITIENLATNIEGYAIYTGLDDINYFGSGSSFPIDTDTEDETDLGFGHCIKVGNSVIGYSYIVLDNGSDVRGTGKCYLVRFNDRFIAQDYVAIDIQASSEILSFGHYNGNIYLWCEDGVDKLHVLDEVTLTDSLLGAGSDFDDLVAPVNIAGTKQYSVSVNEDGIFCYTKELPSTDATKKYEIQDIGFGYIYDTDSKQINHGLHYDGTNIWESSSFDEINFPISSSSKLIKRDNTGAIIASVSPVERYNRDIIKIGSYVYVCYDPSGAAGTIYRWDLALASYINLSFSGLQAGSSYFAYDGTYLWVASIYSGLSLIKIDLSTFTVDTSIGGVGATRGIHFFSTFIWVSTGSEIKKINITTNTVVSTISLNFATYKITDDGTYLYVTHYDNDKVSKINIITEATEKEIVTNTKPYSIEYINGDIWVYCEFELNRINVLNEIVNLVIHTHTGQVTDPVVNNKRLIAGVGNFVFGSYISNKSHGVNDILESLNTDILTSNENPFLIQLDFLGNLKDDDTDYLYSMDLLTFLNEIMPSQIDDTYLYLGWVDLNDHGQVAKVKLSDRTIEYKESETSSQRYMIEGEKDNWFLRGAYLSDNYRKSNSWGWATGLTVYDDFTDAKTFNSNVFFHVLKQITETAGAITIDKIQHLGTPNVPSVVIASGAAGTLLAATELKYYLVFKFVNAATTMLSLATETVTISDITGGGDGSVQAGIKVVVSGCNLENNLGVDIYNLEDVDQIQVYRSKKEWNGALFSEPILLGFLEKDSSNLWYVGGDAHTYPLETFEDNVASPTYNPFTEITALRYPVGHIEVHKNRLILVNPIDYENVSVLQYSDVDNAEAIPQNNARAIESGDGDTLIAAQSMGDYLYLFKTNKIYAILGDVSNGQLLDIDKKVGCKFKNLITNFDNFTYFLNETSIYRVTQNKVMNIGIHRLTDFFNKDRDDAIDFANLDANGYAVVDIGNKEIRFHVTRKINGNAQTTNNFVIIYNVEFNYFKTYSYFNDMFVEEETRDLAEGNKKTLLADYTGNIYEITKDKNDNNNPIDYKVQTKEFDIGTGLVQKSFKVIKINGRYMDNTIFSYIIDGIKDTMVLNRPVSNLRNNVLLKCKNQGKSNDMKIEIEGSAVNDVPFEIDEILIGYTRLRGLL